MFCRNCGKEVENEIKFCPYCGEKVAQKEIEKKDINFFESDATRKAVLKILIGVIIISFFLPMFKVSCLGIVNITMSGKDLAFGINYYGENLGNVIAYILYLAFPCVALIYLFRSKDSKRYGSICVALCGSCVIELINLYLTAEGEIDTAIGICYMEPMISFYLYFILSVVVVILGIYSDYQNMKKGIGTADTLINEKSIKAKCVKRTILYFIGGVAAFDILWSIL